MCVCVRLPCCWHLVRAGWWERLWRGPQLLSIMAQGAQRVQGPGGAITNLAHPSAQLLVSRATPQPRSGWRAPTAAGKTDIQVLGFYWAFRVLLGFEGFIGLLGFYWAFRVLLGF